MKKIKVSIFCAVAAVFVFASCDFYEPYGVVRIQEFPKTEIEKKEETQVNQEKEEKEVLSPEGSKGSELIDEKVENPEDLKEKESLITNTDEENQTEEKKESLTEKENPNNSVIDKEGDENKGNEKENSEVIQETENNTSENLKDSIRDILQEILNSQKETQTVEHENKNEKENESLLPEGKPVEPESVNPQEKESESEMGEIKKEEKDEKQDVKNEELDSESKETESEKIKEEDKSDSENFTKEDDKKTPEKEVTKENEQPEIPEKIPEVVESNKDEPFRRKWTFIVYMAGDNALESSALQDLNEMEAGIADEKAVSVLALLDRHPGFDGTNGNWSDTRLFEVKNDENGKNGTIVSKRIACSELDLFTSTETELDMGNPYTLSQVIDFAQREYEAENYVLVLWGYGYGWRGYIKDGSSDSSLSLPQIHEAVKNKGIHTIIFDTSFGLTAETICELKDECRYIAGTGGINSSAGMDYESFFKKFYESDRSQKSLFNAVSGYSNTGFVVFDTLFGDDFVSSINEFGKAMAGYIDSRAKQKKILEDCLCNIKSYSGSSYPCDCYMDLNNMVMFMKRYTDSDVKRPAENLSSLLINACIMGKTPDISIHLIPLLGKKVTASSHSEEYVKENTMINNGSTKIEFVTEGDFWVPTGNNQSFLDALFYRTY